MLHGFISMEAVNVKEVYSCIRYAAKGVVEGATKKFGEGAVAAVMETAEIQIDFLAVVPCVIVAPPGVHRKATRIQSATRDRLTKGRIGHPIMGAKFNQSARFDCTDDPVGKGNMTVPGTSYTDTVRPPEQRVEVRCPEVAQRLCLQRIEFTCGHRVVSLKASFIEGKYRYKFKTGSTI